MVVYYVNTISSQFCVVYFIIEEQDISLTPCPCSIQQWRLLPYVAAMYILDHFSKTFFQNYIELRVGALLKDASDRQAELGREIHALSSASKPIAGWLARDGIQECREACGGHGYFKGRCEYTWGLLLLCILLE